MCLLNIAKREVLRIAVRPLYLFCMIIAPVFCYLFFTTLMANGLPTDLPAGVVDLDNTSTTRNIIRNLDAFQQTHIVAHYPSVMEARKAIQRGEIYSFYYIPEGTTEATLASRQPKVSFYVNYSYLIAGSLLYKDQRTISELAAGAVGRATLYAKGATEDQAMAFLQPIVIDTHALNNPWLNYSVYLCNTLFPGILMLLIFLTTIYTLGEEVKNGTGRELMHLADNSITKVLIGKLLPHTLVFFVIAVFYNVYLYGYLHYPCHSGIFPMLLAGLLLVLSHRPSVYSFSACSDLSVWLECRLFMGSHFVLHFRIYISGYGHASDPAGIVCPVSSAALLPALCQFCFERLSADLRMAGSSSLTCIPASSFPGIKETADYSAAICLCPLITR